MGGGGGGGGGGGCWLVWNVAAVVRIILPTLFAFHHLQRPQVVRPLELA